MDRKLYQHTWYETNKEKIARHQRHYYQTHREEILAQSRENYLRVKQDPIKYAKYMKNVRLWKRRYQKNYQYTKTDPILPKKFTPYKNSYIARGGNHDEKTAMKQYKKDGWKIIRSGFPDFLAIKRGVIRAIEVKQPKQQLQKFQAEVKIILESRDIEYRVWRKGIENNF